MPQGPYVNFILCTLDTVSVVLHGHQNTSVVRGVKLDKPFMIYSDPIDHAHVANEKAH